MYGPSWDMAVVVTAALTRKKERVLCIESPLPVVPLQPSVGQFSIFRTRPLCTMVWKCRQYGKICISGRVT